MRQTKTPHPIPLLIASLRGPSPQGERAPPKTFHKKKKRPPSRRKRCSAYEVAHKGGGTVARSAVKICFAGIHLGFTLVCYANSHARNLSSTKPQATAFIPFDSDPKRRRHRSSPAHSAQPMNRRAEGPLPSRARAELSSNLRRSRI